MNFIEDYAFMSSPQKNYYLNDNEEITLEDFIKSAYKTTKAPKNNNLFGTCVYYKPDITPTFTKIKRFIDTLTKTLMNLTGSLSVTFHIPTESRTENFTYRANHSASGDSQTLAIIAQNINQRLQYNDIIDTLDAKQTSPVQMTYTGPVSLSPDSEKTIEEFNYGDILYYKSGSGLVSQKTDYPIAICVRTKDESWTGTSICTFMALKYMSISTPDTGTSKQRGIVFGNITALSPQEAYDKMEECTMPDKNWKTGPLRYTSKTPENWSFAWNTVWRYAPYSTERGNWFIPTYREMRDSIPDKKHWKLLEKQITELNEETGHMIMELNKEYMWVCCSTGEAFNPYTLKVSMLSSSTDWQRNNIDAAVIPFIKIKGEIKN